MPEFTLDLFSLGLGMLLVGSCLVWIQGIHQVRSGRPMVPARFRHPAIHVSWPAVILALAWIAQGLSSRLDDDGGQPITTEIALRSAEVSLIVAPSVSLLIVLALVTGARSLADLYKLGFRTDHLGEQLRWGVVGSLASLLPVYLVLWGTTPLRSEDTIHPYLRALGEQGFTVDVIPILLGTVLLAPLLEELLFRVVLQTWLTSYVTPSVAIFLSSVVFAAVHDFPDSLGIFPLAVILGVVFERRRSLIAVVLLHALFNAYNVLGTFVNLMTG